MATALVTFEGLWFNLWKSNIEYAKNGLKATLFITHPDTNEFLVNADEKYVWLDKFHICLTVPTLLQG